MLKSELRQQFKNQRLNLTEQQRAERSQLICDRLKDIDWSKQRRIHYYEPLLELGEVNILPFIDSLKIRYPRSEFYTSRRIGSSWSIVLARNGIAAPLVDFDSIIIPMLAFDHRLHRLGYGGGYYDRLLINQLRAQKIGVCFEIGKQNLLPTEAHDVALDKIITEKANYYSN